jgi:hypothetical protein
LYCNRGVAIVRTPAGKDYALTRDGAALGYEHFTPIRKRDPRAPEIFVSSGKLIQAARRFC